MDGWYTGRRNGGRCAWPGPGWPGRAAAIAGLALTAPALLIFEYQFRHIEAMAASAMIGQLSRRRRLALPR